MLLLRINSQHKKWLSQKKIKIEVKLPKGNTEEAFEAQARNRMNKRRERQDFSIEEPKMQAEEDLLDKTKHR